MLYKIKILFLLLILHSGICFGANNNVLGYGRFTAEEEDSLSLIKQQLLFSATKNLINKAFLRLKLDSKSFWEKFNEKKDEYKEKSFAELITRYETHPEILKKKKRYASLQIDRTFGSLNSLLTKYSIVKRSRSLQNKYRYLIKIRGIINERNLSRMYNQYLYQFKNSQKLTIFLNLSIKNTNFLWDELGTSDLIVLNTIHKNLSIYLNKTFSDTEILIKKMSDVEYIKSNIKDGLYLKLNYLINKVNDNITQSETTFNIKMSVLVLDNNLGKRISSDRKELKNYNFYYSTVGSKKKSLSNLVTYLYQFPLNKIQMAKGIFLNTIPINTFSMLITSYQKLTDVFSLNDFLLQSLVTKQAKLSIKKIASNYVNLDISSIAKAKDISILLKSKIKSSEKYHASKISFQENLLTIDLSGLASKVIDHSDLDLQKSGHTKNN